MRKELQGIVKKATIIFALWLYSLGCSSGLPSEQQFKDWLMIIYTHETGLKADRVFIDVWERSPKEVYDKFPGMDGIDVEAMIMTFPSEDEYSSDIERLEKTQVHYVYCNYYKFTDKWSLHASSWGGGYWKEDPEKWGYLVQDCRNAVSRFRIEFGQELLKKK